MEESYWRSSLSLVRRRWGTRHGDDSVVDGVLGSCDDGTLGEMLSAGKAVSSAKSPYIDIDRNWVSTGIDNIASGGGVGIEKSHRNDEGWLVDEWAGEIKSGCSDGKT